MSGDGWNRDLAGMAALHQAAKALNVVAAVAVLLAAGLMDLPKPWTCRTRRGNVA